MQRVYILCMGKMSEAFFAAGQASYTKRLLPLCRFEVLELAEESINEKNASEATIQAALNKEGERLLAALPKGARLVALCVEGRQISSEELSGWLQDSAVQGHGDVAFVIGSSHGLAQAVKQRAHLCLSLSRLTLPHQMARLMLTEQIYRSFMIQAGTKYHK